MTLSASKEYFEKAISKMRRIQDTQSEAIETASVWIADLFKREGVLHVFGTGHSHMVAEDLFYRAGGLAPVNAILDVNLTMHGGGAPSREMRINRLEGYARILLDNYDVRESEILIVVSRSGANPITIEMAMAAQEKDLKVIALTNVEQSRGLPSRHSSGRKLVDIADLVIDSCLDVGDGCVQIAEDLPKVAPLGTVVSCAILNSIMAEVAARMYRDGIVPPIWVSANLPGSEARNAQLRERFGGSRLRTS
jgi:uncharacterized phosphosugar-binding protein